MIIERLSSSSVVCLLVLFVFCAAGCVNLGPRSAWRTSAMSPSLALASYLAEKPRSKDSAPAAHTDPIYDWEQTLAAEPTSVGTSGPGRSHKRSRLSAPAL